MQFRMFGKQNDGRANAAREAQIMVRHPNNSGLQRDQVSLLYIPANFVEELRVWQGNTLCLEWKLGFRFRRIRISASRMSQTARRPSRLRPGTPQAECSGANGRRVHWICKSNQRRTGRVECKYIVSEETIAALPWKRRRSRGQPARPCALLVGVRGLVKRGFIEGPPHQLEADRQPAFGEAAWDCERWKAGECGH